MTAILFLAAMACLFASNIGLRGQIYRGTFMDSWRAARLHQAPWRLALTMLGSGLLVLSLWRFFAL